MIRRLLSAVLIIALLFSGCGIAAPADSAFIHAEGRKLMCRGKEIVLKGVNAGGWLLTEDWLTPTSLSEDLGTESGQYELEAALTRRHGAEKAMRLIDIYRDNWWTEADFETIADMGFNLIRLPFGYRDLTDDNGVWKPDAFARMDRFVENCTRCGLYVILDLHAAYGSQNGRHHSGNTATGGDLFGNEYNEDLTVELWRTIAAHYKDNTQVAGFDLLNEPEGTPGGLTGKTQWDFYDRLYEEIRAQDTNHLIIMESCWDAEHMPSPKLYGWENVAYEYHYYNWDNGNDLESMKSYFDYKAGQEYLYNILGFNVPVFIGEFTFFDNLDCWRYGLDFFEAHGMSWAMWTYKGCVDSNWVLYGGYARTADTVVTPETDYDTAMRIVSSLQTDNAFHANKQLIALIREYL